MRPQLTQLEETIRDVILSAPPVVVALGIMGLIGLGLGVVHTVYRAVTGA
ncbi:hypothetical protein [Azospirillum sp.]